MTVSAVTKRRYSNATYRTLRRVKTAGLYSGVAAVLVYMLFPYYWAIVSSTKTGQALYQFTLLPALDFSNYRQLFDNPVFMGALVNSGVVALVSTAVSLVIGILAAYALAACISRRAASF